MAVVVTKVCHRCERELPATTEFFNARPGSKDGLRGECRECKSAHNKKYREDHHGELLEYAASWRNDNREKHREASRRWAAANKERCNTNHRRWQEMHPERTSQLMRAAKANARADRFGTSGRLTADEIARQYLRQQGHCYWCGTRVRSEYHLDHVVPLSAGGGNTIDNVVIACPTCNVKKATHLPDEWAGRLC